MSALDDLKAEVAAAVASMDAATAALNARTDDSADLAALRDQLATAQGALDAAVAAKAP